MKLILALLLNCCGLAYAQSGAPKWFESLPDADPAVLVGRGMAECSGNRAEAQAQAKREAMRDLAMSLICSLTAQVEDVQSDAPGQESRFTSRTSVESTLDLVNVKLLREAVTTKAAFALVAADRAEMVAAYRTKVSRSLTSASAAFARGEKIEKEDPRAALSAYEESLAALRDAGSVCLVRRLVRRCGPCAERSWSLPAKNRCRGRAQA